MRKGNIAIPVLAMIFAVIAVVAVVYFGFMRPFFATNSKNVTTNTAVVNTNSTTSNTNEDRTLITNSSVTNSDTNLNTIATTNTNSATNTNTPVAEVKTYTNSTYGFSVKYPSTWTINDQSYTTSGVKYGYLRVSSPLRYDYTGYETPGIQYAVQFKFMNSVEVTDQGFFKGHETGDQDAQKIAVTDAYRNASQEYKDALSIIASAEVTK